MIIHKIAVIASVLIFPTQTLLAATANHEAQVQSAGAKATIAAPIQKVIPKKTVEPLVPGNVKMVTPDNTVIAPNFQNTRLNTIQLSSKQRLLLTNGKSIVKSGINGLNVMGVANTVQSSYKNASLFRGDRQSVWIKENGKQRNVGIFSRIEMQRNSLTSRLSETTVIPKSTSPTSTALRDGHKANVSSGKIAAGTLGKTSSNDDLRAYEQVPADHVQGNPVGSASGVNARPEKDVAGDFENIEVQPKEFEWFHVGADSVLATALVVVDENHQTLSINWGDGDVEKVILRGIQSTLTNEHTAHQSNAFKFRHVYKVPHGETKKSVTISAKNDNGRLVSLSTTEVDINARYKFSMYSVILEFPDHLDSSLEQNSEVEAHMTVKQGGDLFYNRAWKESIYTGGSIKFDWKLPNSNFSREVARLDQGIDIDLNLAELDGIDGSGSGALEFVWDVITAPFEATKWVYEVIKAPLDFDGSNYSNLSGMPLKIHPNTTIGSDLADKATVIYEIGNREGRIIAHFSYDLKLIVPANPASSPSPMNSMN